MSGAASAGISKLLSACLPYSRAIQASSERQYSSPTEFFPTGYSWDCGWKIGFHAGAKGDKVAGKGKRSPLLSTGIEAIGKDSALVGEETFRSLLLSIMGSSDGNKFSSGNFSLTGLFPTAREKSAEVTTGHTFSTGKVTGMPDLVGA